jgi:hypothetical protein
MMINNGTTTAATITPTLPLLDDVDWDAGVGNFAAMVVKSE